MAAHAPTLGCSGSTTMQKLLQRTLDEEGDTDHLLTDIAERVINVEALMGEAGSDRAVNRNVARDADVSTRSSTSSSRTTRRSDADLEA